jgi:hypothetical protein
MQSRLPWSFANHAKTYLRFVSCSDLSGIQNP